MLKVLYIISDIDRAKAFEWIADYFDSDASIEVSFCFLACKMPATADYLSSRRHNVFYISIEGKRNWPAAFVSLVQLIRSVNPEIVHCHLLTASVLGLCAAYVANIKNRIFTRHHGSMHHKSHPKGVAWDYLCNSLATKIVSISPATSHILSNWERVPRDKVVFIPHGFPFSSSYERPLKKYVSFQQRHSLPDDKKIVGVVSRLEGWKGVQFTIEAFKSIVSVRHDVHLLLMNAVGSLLPTIQAQLSELPNSDYTIVPFDSDMSSAYAVMDVFVHVPVDPYVEAFGQVYVEALASGLPMICTLSGIAPAIIKHEENALVVPFQDAHAIEAALLRLFIDQELCITLSTNGRKVLSAGFSLEIMCEKLQKLYLLCA